MGQLVNIRSFKLYFKLLWNNSWNFSNKFNFVNNIIEDISIEKFVIGFFNRAVFKFFFFSHLRIEKIFKNYYFNIFFFDNLAASFFNNSLMSKNIEYKGNFLNKLNRKNLSRYNSFKYLSKDEKRKLLKITLYNNVQVFNNLKSYYLNNKYKLLKIKKINSSKFIFLKGKRDKSLTKNYIYFLLRNKNIKNFFYLWLDYSLNNNYNLELKNINFLYFFNIKSKLNRKISKKSKGKRFKKRRFFLKKKKLSIINNKSFFYLLKNSKKLLNFKSLFVKNNLYNFNYYSSKNNLIFYTQYGSFLKLNFNDLFSSFFFKKKNIQDYLFFKEINLNKKYSAKYYFDTEIEYSNFFLIIRDKFFIENKIYRDKNFFFFINYLNLNVSNLRILKSKLFEKIFELYLDDNSFNFFKFNKIDYIYKKYLKYPLNKDLKIKDSIIIIDDYIKNINFNYKFLNIDLYKNLLKNKFEFIKYFVNSKISYIFSYFIIRDDFKNYLNYLKEYPNILERINLIAEVGYQKYSIMNFKSFGDFKVSKFVLEQISNFNLNFFSFFRFFYYSILNFRLNILNNLVSYNYTLKLYYYLINLKKKMINNILLLTKLINNIIKFKNNISKSVICKFNIIIKKIIYLFKKISKNIFIFDKRIFKNKLILNLFKKKKKKEDKKNTFLKKVYGKKYDASKIKSFFEKKEINYNNLFKIKNIKINKNNFRINSNFNYFRQLQQYLINVNGFFFRQNIKNTFLMSCCFFSFYSNLSELHLKIQIFKIFLNIFFFKMIGNKKNIFINFFILNDPTPEIISLFIKNLYYVRLKMTSLVKPMVHNILRNFVNIMGILVKCKGRFTRDQRASRFSFIAGKVPLNNFESLILYYQRNRVFVTGVGSIKVWISYKNYLIYNKIN